MDTPPFRLRAVPFASPAVQTLVARVQEEYVARYGGPDESPLEVGDFDPPRGAFFVGTLGERPVAMGGWRRRDDVPALGRVAAAEVKRMYVVPEARRHGYARDVLAHLEATASAAGADVMVLETGTMQPEAIAMYAAAGYEPVAGFGHYVDSPLSRCFAKRL